MRPTRTINPALSLRIGITLLLFFILGLGTCLAAECRAPSYREGHVWEDTPSSIMMNISIAMSDFAPKRLICLAEVLKHHYADRERISIAIFSSYDAAKHYTRVFRGDLVGGSRVMWELHDHGSYVFDAEKHEEYIVITPFAQSFLFSTRINLPINTAPPCTLEIAGRCLLALSGIDYPWEALKARISGTITLEGMIARDGSLRHIQASGPQTNPGDARRLLVDAALKNLKTWRFETASHPDPLRIAYSYTIDSSGSPGHTSLKFELPEKVQIHGVPPTASGR